MKVNQHLNIFIGISFTIVGPFDSLSKHRCFENAWTFQPYPSIDPDSNFKWKPGTNSRKQRVPANEQAGHKRIRDVAWNKSQLYSRTCKTQGAGDHQSFLQLAVTICLMRGGIKAL